MSHVQFGVRYQHVPGLQSAYVWSHAVAKQSKPGQRPGRCPLILFVCGWGDIFTFYVPEMQLKRGHWGGGILSLETLCTLEDKGEGLSFGFPIICLENNDHYDQLRVGSCPAHTAIGTDSAYPNWCTFWRIVHHLALIFSWSPEYKNEDSVTQACLLLNPIYSIEKCISVKLHCSSLSSLGPVLFLLLSATSMPFTHPAFTFCPSSGLTSVSGSVNFPHKQVLHTQLRFYTNRSAQQKVKSM